MKTKSEVTGIEYLDADCVFFRNIEQSVFYLKNGVQLVDIFLDSKKMLVFVFYREEHQKTIKKWMDNKVIAAD